MIRLLSFVVGVLSTSWAFSQTANIPDGTWKWSADLGGNTINSVLKLETVDGSLTGTYADQNIEAKVVNSSVSDDKVSFEIETDYEGNSIKAEFEGTLDSAEIDGNVTVYLNGDERASRSWNATRYVGSEEVVGTWEFDFTAPDGTRFQPIFNVAHEDGDYKITLDSDELELDVQKVRIEGSVLKFEYDMDYGGTALHVAYRCHPTGNQLTGELDYEMAGNSGTFPIKAQRRALSSAARRMLGTWNFAMTGPDGVERTPKLIVKEVGGRLAATISNGDLTFEISDPSLKDGQLSFGFQNDHDGTAVHLNWSCRLVGDDAMEGKIEFDAAGNTGEIPLSGKRAE